MKIIEPSAILLTPTSREEGIECLRKIENFGRISHKSEDSQTDSSWERFISAVVMTHGDFSIIEHATASVIFRVDRGITHELVRHRLFSFTQESTRFVNGQKKYPDGLEFIMPNGGYYLTAEDAFQHAEQKYTEMLNQGVRPQEARSVLPNALASTIGMTGNLRAWRWFFLARTSRESHPDMRRVTIPLLEVFKQRIPILFDDITPGERQIENFRKAH